MDEDVHVIDGVRQLEVLVRCINQVIDVVYDSTLLVAVVVATGRIGDLDEANGQIVHRPNPDILVPSNGDLLGIAAKVRINVIPKTGADLHGERVQIRRRLKDRWGVGKPVEKLCLWRLSSGKVDQGGLV